MALGTFSPIRCGTSQTPSLCRHNILVVSHGIVGPNKQTPLTGPNKLPHRGRGSTLIPFVMTRTQPCKYCLLKPWWLIWAQSGQYLYGWVRVVIIILIILFTNVDRGVTWTTFIWVKFSNSPFVIWVFHT